jgi:hypothetical protein
VVDGFTRQAILANHSFFSRQVPCRPAPLSGELSNKKRGHLRQVCAVDLTSPGQLANPPVATGDHADLDPDVVEESRLAPK